MFAADSGTEVGVVSDGEFDGNDNAPVVVKTVQVGAKWAAGVIIVVGRWQLTGGEVALASSSGLLPVSLSGGVNIASDRSRIQVARDNRRAAADSRCGRMAVMAWSCRSRRWLR